MRTSHATESAGNYVVSQGPQHVNEPTTKGVANELEKFVSVLEDRIEETFSILFGENNEKANCALTPNDIDGLMRNLCERTASCCGSLATLNSRLGVSMDTPAAPPKADPRR